ncbi:YcaO-like family protein, partial [Streptomyces alkaliterrae]
MTTAGAWPVQVFRPFPEVDDVVFARTAARSADFGPADAAGGSGTAAVIGGAAGDRPEEVRVRALAELVERTSNILAGRHVESHAPPTSAHGPPPDPGRPTATVLTSHDRLRRHGVPALDPAALQPAVPAEQSRSARQLWVSGRSLLTGHRLFLPAGAVFLRHRPPHGATSPFRAGSTGLAAHRSQAAAIDHAAAELWERDLLRRSWSGELPAETADRATAAACGTTLSHALSRLGLRAQLLTIPAVPPDRCVVACLHRQRTRSHQSFGARLLAPDLTPHPNGDPAGVPAHTAAGRPPGSAGHAPPGASHQPTPVERAVRAAVYEALMVRWSMSTLAARRALPALRSRGGPPRSELEHALWAYHRQDSLSLWRRRPGRSPLAAVAPAGPSTATRRRLPPVAERLSAYTGGDVFAVDTTRPQARAEGWCVVRILAPGAG